MAQKSKDKGKAGERFFCAMLSKHLGGSFIRVPNSGAFVGQTNRARILDLSSSQVLIHRGDVIPPDHLPNLVVECKFYKDFGFHQLLQPEGVKILDKWIVQASSDAGPDNFWILLFKINRRGGFAVYDKRRFPDAEISNHVVYDSNFVCLEAESFISRNADRIRELGGKRREAV
jgi:hypothetical protein